ncbi:uncharacterized protein LOC108676011, partial [Hyalella azteca]|uniref:Uncharacterized protein LOC108676011 n=1 Tax=Hyalella azteca TaxID=294128 RepID=A0A8B7P0R3_HYAAZ
MAPIATKCSVLLHQLSDAAVGSGRCPERSLTQASLGGSKIKTEGPEVPAIYIKEEPEGETEEVSIKEEPFVNENEACAPVHLSPASALSSCVPFKMETKAEACNAHPNSSQNISALVSNQ